MPNKKALALITVRDNCVLRGAVPKTLEKVGKMRDDVNVFEDGVEAYGGNTPKKELYAAANTIRQILRAREMVLNSGVFTTLPHLVPPNNITDEEWECMVVQVITAERERVRPAVEVSLETAIPPPVAVSVPPYPPPVVTATTMVPVVIPVNPHLIPEREVPVDFKPPTSRIDMREQLQVQLRNVEYAQWVNSEES